MVQITVKTGSETVVIYDQDGSSYTTGPDAEHVFELADDGFCTISDSPDQPGEDFAERMVEFWRKIKDAIQGEIDELPKPTPV